MTQPITPRLIVPRTGEAIAFYEAAFGANELERYTAPDGKVVHAAISIDGFVVSLADEDVQWNNASPSHLGGSPVILQLVCEDPDAVAERAVKHGARVVFPVQDQFYGHREGRIADPFGHLWIVSKIVRELTPEEIQRGVDDFDAG